MRNAVPLSAGVATSMHTLTTLLNFIVKEQQPALNLSAQFNGIAFLTLAIT